MQAGLAPRCKRLDRPRACDVEAEEFILWKGVGYDVDDLTIGNRIAHVGQLHQHILLRAPRGGEHQLDAVRTAHQVQRQVHHLPLHDPALVGLPGDQVDDGVDLPVARARPLVAQLHLAVDRHLGDHDEAELVLRRGLDGWAGERGLRAPRVHPPDGPHDPGRGERLPRRAHLHQPLALVRGEDEVVVAYRHVPAVGALAVQPQRHAEPLQPERHVVLRQRPALLHRLLGVEHRLPHGAAAPAGQPGHALLPAAVPGPLHAEGLGVRTRHQRAVAGVTLWPLAQEHAQPGRRRRPGRPRQRHGLPWVHAALPRARALHAQVALLLVAVDKQVLVLLARYVEHQLVLLLRVAAVQVDEQLLRGRPLQLQRVAAHRHPALADSLVLAVHRGLERGRAAPGHPVRPALALLPVAHPVVAQAPIGVAR